MAPVYKLTYFNITGLGEPLRFLMKYGGIEFEDIRVEIEQWPEVKQTVPFGQLPILEIDNKQYNQSLAICRFLAKRLNLAGKDEWEDLEIDAVLDTYADLRIKLATYAYEQDPAIKESRKAPLFEEILPYYMTRFEQMAKDNGGYLACKKLTWADLFFVPLADYLGIIAETDLLDKYPNLQTVRKNVLEIPAIKQWVETRPDTDRDYFNAVIKK